MQIAVFLTKINTLNNRNSFNFMQILCFSYKNNINSSNSYKFVIWGKEFMQIVDFSSESIHEITRIHANPVFVWYKNNINYCKFMEFHSKLWQKIAKKCQIMANGCKFWSTYGKFLPTMSLFWQIMANLWKIMPSG